MTYPSKLLKFAAFRWDGVPIRQYKTADVPYREIQTLSFEAREKLHAIRPTTLGQAGRIPGVSPSDLQNLVLEILKREGQAASTSS